MQLYLQKNYPEEKIYLDKNGAIFIYFFKTTRDS